MRLLFVGYGSIAAQHARTFQELGGVILEGVVGRLSERAEAFAKEYGFAFYTTSLSDALRRDSCDAVVICSPSDLHAEQTEMSLRAGKDVLCEIPLATNLADAERVVTLAESCGRTLMVAHTQRFWPGLRELRRRVESGEFHPHHVICRWGFLRRENVNWTGRRRSWTDNLLWHHGCHVVDMALWVLGEGETQAVRGILGPPSESLGIPLDLSLSVRTAGSRVVSIAMSYNTPTPFHDYLFIGEEATYAYHSKFGAGRLRSGDETIYESKEPSMLSQNAEFLNSVADSREPSVSGRSVLPTMRVLQAVQDQNA